jgi:hypothetical protein
LQSRSRSRARSHITLSHDVLGSTKQQDPPLVVVDTIGAGVVVAGALVGALLPPTTAPPAAAAIGSGVPTDAVTLPSVVVDDARVAADVAVTDDDAERDRRSF